MRTIAAIVSHVHNIRLKWLRLSVPHVKRPMRLDRLRCTQKEAQLALAESGARCCEMIAEAEIFQRDGWARPWPAGDAMVAYLFTHDAHHRSDLYARASTRPPAPGSRLAGDVGLGAAI
jgi:hypothetical protein